MTRSATRRRVLIVAPITVTLLGVAAWSWLQDEDSPTSSAVTATGESGDPGCGPVRRVPTRGAGAHIDDEPIIYDSAPPSFGDHHSRWEVRAHSFYDVETRPPVPTLVHNLEHGYNILWYDGTVIADVEAMDRVRAIADTYATLDRGRDPATAFIAAPWTSADGPGFPDGMNYALTHWYANPNDRSSSRADELGLTQYCADISAGVVRKWMDDYPLKHAPEGYPDLM